MTEPYPVLRISARDLKNLQSGLVLLVHQNVVWGVANLLGDPVSVKRGATDAEISDAYEEEEAACQNNSL